MALLEVKNLNKIYEVGLFVRRQIHAVKNVNFSVERGEIISLVGESGSGKTTLAKITLALIKPTNGEVLFQGKNIFKMSEKEFRYYRLNAQYIPQDPYASIHPFKKIGDILIDVLKYHRLANSYKEALEIVKDVMGKAGLNPPEKYLDKYPFN